MRLISISTTCGSVAEAENIARALVEERLVACASIGAPITSTYVWEGKLEQSEELPLTLKTLPELFEKVRGRIRALHGYTTPMILSMPVEQVDDNYFNWVVAAVQL